MAERYYLPENDVLELKEILDAAQTDAPGLVADIRRLVFGTEVPEDLALKLEEDFRTALPDPFN
ncbi:hypothetical protein SDC9_66602 [bioreactor metagenome]|uniref:Uncharacterized protein n=1 Tax=bioreactor metagenome TaxID=1076179 RepID=A0A644Y0W1_9ZZZZ